MLVVGLFVIEESPYHVLFLVQRGSPDASLGSGDFSDEKSLEVKQPVELELYFEDQVVHGVSGLSPFGLLPDELVPLDGVLALLLLVVFSIAELQ